MQKKTDFDKKLKRKWKNVTSNKIKHVKETNWYNKKVAHISGKGHDILLGRMYFTGKDGFQKFLVFAPILSLLTLDNNKNVTNWVSTRISPAKIEPFDTTVELWLILPMEE